MRSTEEKAAAHTVFGGFFSTKVLLEQIKLINVPQYLMNSGIRGVCPIT